MSDDPELRKWRPAFWAWGTLTAFASAMAAFVGFLAGLTKAEDDLEEIRRKLADHRHDDDL